MDTTSLAILYLCTALSSASHPCTNVNMYLLPKVASSNCLAFQSPLLWRRLAGVEYGLVPGLAGEELRVVAGVLPHARARTHEEGVLRVLPPAVRVLLDI